MKSFEASRVFLKSLYPLSLIFQAFNEFLEVFGRSCYTRDLDINKNWCKVQSEGHKSDTILSLIGVKRHKRWSLKSELWQKIIKTVILLEGPKDEGL